MKIIIGIALLYCLYFIWLGYEVHNAYELDKNDENF
jgi:hypothetical protein